MQTVYLVSYQPAYESENIDSIWSTHEAALERLELIREAISKERYGQPLDYSIYWMEVDPDPKSEYLPQYGDAP